MADREQPYDPYIPSAGQGGAAGAGGSSQQPGTQRTAALQAQIDDTVDVMKENINKVSQRGERIDNIQHKTNGLADSARDFRRGANKVRKQMWWKDMKMRMCLIIGIIILLIVIIVPIGKVNYEGTWKHGRACFALRQYSRRDNNHNNIRLELRAEDLYTLLFLEPAFRSLPTAPRALLLDGGYRIVAAVRRARESPGRPFLLL
ncbi:MAG: hypothetical protein M1814_003752 [Vezdaea aestivalis]|nr:MAG: hypothetical protein M1814_003752 [Vezdaea aestivalis]